MGAPGEQPEPRPGADLIIPVLAAGFTLYFLISTWSLVWEARATATLLGVTLLGLVAMQIVRSGLDLRRGYRLTIDLDILGATRDVRIRRLGLVALMAAFVALIPWLGTTLGLFLVMILSMTLLGVRDWRMLLGIPLLMATLVYLLFIALLESKLPAGPVEDLIAYLGGGG